MKNPDSNLNRERMMHCIVPGFFKNSFGIKPIRNEKIGNVFENIDRLIPPSPLPFPPGGCMVCCVLQQDNALLPYHYRNKKFHWKYK